MTAMTQDGVAALFAELSVLRRGHFQLSSGKHSDTYLQCALALQDPAIALELGAALADRVRDLEIDVVVAPALGGVIAGFAVAAALDVPFLFTERTGEGTMTLRRGQAVSAGSRVLIVEDVVTTGGSADEVARLCTDAGADVVGIASIVDRSPGLADDERPAWSPVSLLTVVARTWAADSCPLCASDTPLSMPGSRHSR